MAKQNPPRPTDAELAILRVLWRKGPCTVRDVQEELARGQPTGYTTALKLLQIMAEKGLVDRDESRRTHVYRAQPARGADPAATGRRPAGAGLRRLGPEAGDAGAGEQAGVGRGAGRDPRADRSARRG